MSKQFSSTIMRVSRVSAPGTKDAYQVFEQNDDGSWGTVSKPYPHSTSAFAALGRQFQKQVLEFLKGDK